MTADVNLEVSTAAQYQQDSEFPRNIILMGCHVEFLHIILRSVSVDTTWTYERFRLAWFWRLTSSTWAIMLRYRACSARSGYIHSFNIHDLGMEASICCVFLECWLSAQAILYLSFYEARTQWEPPWMYHIIPQLLLLSVAFRTGKPAGCVTVIDLWRSRSYCARY